MPTALYRAEHIGPAQMRRGYMLVSMLNPDITPQDWRRFARCAARGPRERGGLIAILDPRGYCHAIFSYRMGESLAAGRSLRVADVVMGRLPGNTLPQAVIACAEALAAQYGGLSIHIDLMNSMLSREDGDLLRAAGFEESGRILTRSAAASMSLPRPDASPAAAASSSPLEASSSPIEPETHHAP